MLTTMCCELSGKFNLKLLGKLLASVLSSSISDNAYARMHVSERGTVTTLATPFS